MTIGINRVFWWILLLGAPRLLLPGGPPSKWVNQWSIFNDRLIFLVGKMAPTHIRVSVLLRNTDFKYSKSFLAVTLLCLIGLNGVLQSAFQKRRLNYIVFISLTFPDRLRREGKWSLLVSFLYLSLSLEQQPFHFVLIILVYSEVLVLIKYFNIMTLCCNLWATFKLSGLKSFRLSLLLLLL